MRLRENEIDLVAGRIIRHLERAGSLQSEAEEPELRERIKQAIIDDLVVEDNLNREVEEILKSHTKDLASGAIDYRRMFSMIKSKLARDRNLILG
jgi:hypothetical protein